MPKEELLPVVINGDYHTDYMLSTMVAFDYDAFQRKLRHSY